ncbi:MAG TPA: EAL domain-containing protein [Devosia sp.]|nr:EAL domain-containing protein [Devosia sp.]
MDRYEASETAAAERQLSLMSVAANETKSAIYVTDEQANIVYVNSVFTRMLGYELADVVGRRAREVLGSTHYVEKDYTRLWNDLRRGRSVEQEVRTYDRHGREVWLSLTLRPVFGPDGAFRHLVGILEDTTEARQIQSLQRDVLEAMAQETPLGEVMTLVCERVESIFPEVMCSILAVDSEQKLRPLAAPSLPQHYNDAIDGLPIGPSVGSCGTAAWRGEAVSVEDIETDPLWADFKALAVPLGLQACWSSPIKLRDGRVAGTFAFYFRERRGPGAWHEQVVKACVQLCMLAIERDEARARIDRLAFYDELTGLPNRTRLREEMVRYFDEAEAPEAALIFLDIDHFKDVNDTLGHSVGDSFLRALAGRIRKAVWDVDIVSRHGGDEFVIVLAGATALRAQRVAEKLLRVIGEAVVVEGVSLPASASIGISMCPRDGHDCATLLRNADTAMYQAKSQGRNTYRFFSPEMNRMAQDRLLLGALLRDAIANRQITFSYQPQIDARTGALAGVEALARWRHPALGVVPPSRFIPIAEDCGLVEAIGEFAIAEACGQLKAWDASGVDVPRVAVNISPIQFRNPRLPEVVAATLAATGIAPSRLVIEITEGVMMDAFPSGIANAAALRNMGVSISVDDFGTGYSSLSHLARLPVSELKIDRSFMADLEDSETVRALVTAVIRIGESLGLTVVAEGVETLSQRRFLEALGCDLLQGYFFAEAMTPEMLEQWIAARGRQAVRGAA